MNDGTAGAAPRAPWHLWAVGILALLWNGFGAYDYVMTATENAAYFEMMGVTPDMAAYFAAMPVWQVAAWAVGVWAAVLAAISLLLRKGWAAWLFALSLIGMIVSMGASLANADARAMGGAMGLIMAGAVFVIGVFELAYSAAMKKSGVLR